MGYEIRFVVEGFHGKSSTKSDGPDGKDKFDRKKRDDHDKDDKDDSSDDDGGYDGDDSKTKWEKEQEKLQYEQGSHKSGGTSYCENALPIACFIPG